MGRMNFGKGIYDWKGITEKVELQSDKGVELVKDWKVYTIPVDYSFARDKQYKQQENVGNQPAYYRSTFNLNELGDTFLNMMNWSKGMVWVNGHAIGRYWEIPPQQTLYVPGCWLKKGENEIIILDMVILQKPKLKVCVNQFWMYNVVTELMLIVRWVRTWT